MQSEEDHSAYRDAYPEGLERSEQLLLESSRTGRSRKAPASVRECTGVGLSGGGIRSATFALGVFQGMATLGLLSIIDFLSTVSGGGYFGSFYTRLFLRREVADFRFVEETLVPSHPPGTGREKDRYQRGVLDWLRENGRYLSPKGSGDLLLAGAVLFRNWVVVQLVLAFFFLLFFLSAQLIRIPLDPWFTDLPFLKEPHTELELQLPLQLKVWTTPFVLVPVLLFVFGAVPVGWAYWMVGRQPPKGEFWKRPVTGLVFVAVVAMAAWFRLPHSLLPPAFLLVCVLTAFWVALDQLRSSGVDVDDPALSRYRETFSHDMARNLTSSQLKIALMLTLASLAFVLVDSLAQTVYIVLLTPTATLRSWGSGVIAALFALSPFGSRIMISFQGKDAKKRPRSLTKLAAAVAAFLIITLLLVAVDVAANAVAWSLQKPANAPADIGKKQESAKLVDSEVVANPDEPNNWSLKGGEAPSEAPLAPERSKALLWEAWGCTVILSFLFGQSWPFLNRSTQLPLYSARLIRAYLGASNPRRVRKGAQDEQEGGAVTRVIPGDDINLENYWHWPGQAEREREEPRQGEDEIYGKGTPLHLVNVTINETLDGRSQVQQQDRKGVGMALGPAGISAGVRHHVVFHPPSGRVSTFPASGFRVFNYGGDPEQFGGEILPLGQWLSISGAAFSTGLGARTNLALSLLTGVGNVRLGYWWNSGVVPEERSGKEKATVTQRLGALFTLLFPAQSYLLDEYTARYHGTARKHWYLTDGGHFENMAGYELIRRRLRLIVIVDAEADPDYNFGGLAGLIRKARIDFGAEISFLDDDALARVLPEGHCFSTLENLRRGKRVEGKREGIESVEYGRFSLAHAALATVTYDCGNKAQSCLIYIKPTLIGNESADVLQYHVEHPAFPQEPTSDQFFDEAQWESYRALGEHIARQVFNAPQGRDTLAWLEELAERVLRN